MDIKQDRLLSHAMVLAAGRGNRMRPLTDFTPKPLLQVSGVPLIQWHLDALHRGGIRSVVINVAWLGQQLVEHARRTAAQMPTLTFEISNEAMDFGSALETAGGICRALPHLGDVFWLVAGDVFAPNFNFEHMMLSSFAKGQDLAHLWLVPNPAHRPGGDFMLNPNGSLGNLPSQDLVLTDSPTFTYSGIGLFRRTLFERPWCDIPFGNPQGLSEPLAPVLKRAIAQGRVTGEIWPGDWTDVGTPERLAALNREDNGIL